MLSQHNHHYTNVQDDMVTDAAMESNLELRTEECLQLKLLLLDRNMSLPPAQRRASGYKVRKLAMHD